jgi:Ca-activated chloride channel family protein
MPNGRTPGVRSHRRGGPRRRTTLAPALIISTVAILAIAGLGAGYVYFVKGACTGSVSANVLVSPNVESIVRQAATEWAASDPSVNGTCAKVDIQAKDSAVVAAALSDEWDVKADGPAPDAWVPESSAWVRRASVDADAERMMPDLQPSLGRTPTVIAMPKPMAEAAGVIGKKLTWQKIIDMFSSPKGWETYGHPEWGAFKVGLTDPQKSTAGLLALMAISDTDDNGEVSAEERATLFGLKKIIKVRTDSTLQILSGIRTAADRDEEAGLKYVSAFPALERDVLEYNLSRPKIPLVAIYPQDGSAEADTPYLVLSAPWVSPTAQGVAAAFLATLRAPEQKSKFLANGFRDANRAPGKDLVPANGVVEKITALPRAVLLPESVQQATASWTAVTRPTNLLLVFDTSGSMNGIVEGIGKSRLDLTKAAALDALKLFSDDARVGIWAFSSVTTSEGKDYREVLPLGTLGEPDETGASTHRDAVESNIKSLQANGFTGLYNATWAAQQEVQKNREAGATNLVVLLTDGADDNNVAGGLSLDQLTSKLRSASGDATKRVPVITVGLGSDTDSDVLREISSATKAPSYSSPTSFDISQVLLTALFARI